MSGIFIGLIVAVIGLFIFELSEIRKLNHIIKEHHIIEATCQETNDGKTEISYKTSQGHIQKKISKVQFPDFKVGESVRIIYNENYPKIVVAAENGLNQLRFRKILFTCNQLLLFFFFFYFLNKIFDFIYLSELIFLIVVIILVNIQVIYVFIGYKKFIQK